MSERRYLWGRPAEGETIDVPPFGRCEVLEHTDPSIVRLRTASGAEAKIGDKALRQMQLDAEREQADGSAE